MVPEQTYFLLEAGFSHKKHSKRTWQKLQGSHEPASGPAESLLLHSTDQKQITGPAHSKDRDTRTKKYGIERLAGGRGVRISKEQLRKCKKNINSGS